MIRNFIAAIVVLAVIAVIALAVWSTGTPKDGVGGVYESLATSFPAITIGGDSTGKGTQISKMLTGTCNIEQKTPGSFAATTSGQFYCRDANVRAGDRVFATLPTGAGINANGSGTSYGAFVLVSAYATSTGFIGFTIENLTGAATSSFRFATTGVQYWITSTSTPR